MLFLFTLPIDLLKIETHRNTTQAYIARTIYTADTS